ncbi:MAG: hypothetical protein J5I91_09980 [Bacteroidetes bacterium]|nr:hypothetical protein [Bacteroidota bacterium]
MGSLVILFCKLRKNEGCYPQGYDNQSSNRKQVSANKQNVTTTLTTELLNKNGLNKGIKF